MRDFAVSALTVCGLEELQGHRSVGVTHVLSIIDPEQPDPAIFSDFRSHDRILLRFDDDIEPAPGLRLPARGHIDEILAFGRTLKDRIDGDGQVHLLVHCHMGVSRSTAATAILMAQIHPEIDEREVFARILAMRPQAWPNGLMVAFADEALGRDGRLNAGAASLYAARIANDPALARHMRENGRAGEAEWADLWNRGAAPHAFRMNR